MLHFIGDFEEYELADRLRKYIPLYLKRPEDSTCYVPYYDDNQKRVRYVKFAYLKGPGWTYVDNSQES